MSCSGHLCARRGVVVSVLCFLLGACSSIMIVSNFNNDIRGYEVGDGTRLNGNVPPDLIISSPGWGVAAYYNTVFVANPSGSITVFEVGLGGYSSQLPTIAGDATGLNGPLAVAVDSGGNIYVTTDGSSVDNQQKVLVYAKGASGNVAPIATIAGSNTGLFGPGAIAVDAARRIYVANRGHCLQPGRTALRCMRRGQMVMRVRSRRSPAPTPSLGSRRASRSMPTGPSLSQTGTLTASTPMRRARMATYHR
jgi:hypothetical protein